MGQAWGGKLPHAYTVRKQISPDDRPLYALENPTLEVCIFFRLSLSVPTKKSRPKFQIPLNQDNIGRAYSLLGEPEKAIMYYQKTLVMSEKLDNKYVIALTNMYLAEIYMERREFEQVEKLLSKSLMIAEEINSQILIRNIFENYAKLYKLRRKYKKALEYTVKFYDRSYEMFNEDSKKRIEKLQVQYETEKKEREAEIFRLKNVELIDANQKLKEALDQVKVMGGLIPICANCKRIRDDKGFWNQLEAYLTEHSDASFTHGICPSCVDNLYGDFEKNINNESLQI